MAKTNQQRTGQFLLLQCIALSIAAVGWEAWLDVYYRNGIFEKILWFVAAITPFVFVPKKSLITISLNWKSGFLLIGSGLLCWILLGFPFGIPAIFLIIGVSSILISNRSRLQAFGSFVFIFALLVGIQALLIPFLIWLAASGSNIPWLASIVATFVKLTGIDAGVNNGQIVIRNAHFAWNFAPSIGTLGMIWITIFTVSAAVLVWRIRNFLTAFVFCVAMLCLFPLVRYVILIMLYLQWETLDWFFSPLISVILLIIVVVNLVTIGKRRFHLEDKVLDFSTISGSPFTFPKAVSFVLIPLAIFLIIFSLLLPDPGKQKDGYVLVDEAHGGWEWTTESFDTDWYGEASTYNYWCMLDYISAHYPTKRNHQEINSEVLADSDVLIIKTPSKLFKESEIDAIVDWVSSGGGLYIIGDHTNVFGMTTCLQPIMKRFGMEFGYDATYELENGSLQTDNIQSLLRHPVISEMPQKLLWGTSCSLSATIDAKPILIGNHIRSHYLDYGKRSFFASAYMAPSERYGFILQSAGVKHGKGRVVAFTDSTIFSNFWTFFPGKSELFLGSVNWLNRKNTVCLVSWFNLISGLLCIILIKIIRKSERIHWGCYLISFLIAIPLAIQTRDACAKSWYALPNPQTPLKTLVFERQYSDAGMPDFYMQGNAKNSFQTFYTWVQRVGVIPRCEYSFSKATEKKNGRIVMIRPQKEMPQEDLLCLEQFLKQGGRLLIIDGPSNPKSLVNLLLQRWKLSIDFRPLPGGRIQIFYGSELPPDMLISSVCQVEGGQPILKAGNVTVLSRISVYAGEIWACSLADNWSDASLGVSNATVNDNQRLLSELQYWTIKLFMADN